MVDAYPQMLETHARGDWVRLRTLVILRWLAVAGQLGAVIAAGYVLNVSLRLDLCLVVIACSAAFNIAVTLAWPQTTRLSNRAAVWTLLFDLVQLGVLLGLCGGLTNPFSALLLAPVVIAASALGARPTLILVGAATVVILALGILYRPLFLLDGTALTPPPLLVHGSAAALLTAVGFVALYARWVSLESNTMSDALLATQMALAREQQLTALGGVVAAAAHELGTPLATITLVASELADELADNPDLRADAQLIRSQADRCRDILRDMGRSGKDDSMLHHLPATALVLEAAGPHLNRGKQVILRANGAPTDSPSPDQPLMMRAPEIVHGLRNLVQNAVDFAVATVWVDLDWDDHSVSVRVGDDGAGYPNDLIGRIGDPFVRKRTTERGPDTARPGYEGMGLGLFIAKTLLERSGADLTFANGTGLRQRGQRAQPVPVEHARPTGAIVEVRWRRDRIVVAANTARQALGDNPRNDP